MPSLDPLYVVLLNLNTSGETIECIDSLAPTLPPGARIVVVDNGSADDSVRVLVRLPAWRNNFTLGQATVREDPTAAMFHVYVGNEYRLKGQGGLARIEYVAAIANDPLGGEAYLNLAGVLVDDGNTSAAEEVLRWCAQRNSTFPKLPYVQGKLALKRGSRDEARDFFLKALSRDPNDLEALYDLGMLAMEDDRLDEAESFLARAVIVDPSFATAHLNLGAVLARQKKFSSAEAEFRRAIELAPHTEAPYLALAGVYEDEGRREDALGLYRRIVNEAPNSGNAQFRLGVLAQKMGKSDEAIKALESAVALQPKSALARAQLGLACLAAGQADRAKREIESARLLDPNNETVKTALRKLGR